MRRWGLAVTWVLMGVVSAAADTYVFDHTSSAFEETVILNDILLFCQARREAQESVPSSCTADCAACTPTNAEKAAWVLDKGPTKWLQTQRRALRETRASQACTLYKQANDALRAEVDPLANMPLLPSVNTADSYSWNVITTNTQERVIRDSLRKYCEDELSATRTPPEGCTATCDCTATTTGTKLDHLWNEAFVRQFFDQAWARIQGERAGVFCNRYLDLSRTTQEQIDALLGLPPLP